MVMHIRTIHPTISSSFDAAAFQYLETEALKISAVNLTSGPSTLASSLEVALATPQTCARAIQAEREGVDALVIDCMGDIGCEEARECVSIPVLGPYETSLHVAGLLSRRIGVVTMVDSVVRIMESTAVKYGMQEKLVSVRAINMPVEEMQADEGRRNQRLIELSRHMVETEGADAIVLGCSEMHGADAAVSCALQKDGIDIPVIDPVPATIRIASALVQGRLSHSKRSYPTPQPDAIAGYEYFDGLV